MGIDPNDEIMQDFLVSSVEILEQLDKQLVELEQSPQDHELLNAVFRGFHTIKGGASFLNLHTLVEVCHRGEDVFNLLRRGERRVTPQLMDVVLRVLDTVNEMFRDLNAGTEPPAADPALLAQLEQLAAGGDAAAPAPAPAAPPPAPSAASDDITDAEFESLLDALAGSQGAAPTPPAAAAAAAPDEISDDEFESLLDQLHGAGAPPAASTEPAPAAPAKQTAGEPPPAKTADHAPAKPAADHKEPKAAAAPRAADAGAAAATADATVRVDTQRLDDIMNMVGELVLVRNRLANLQTLLSDEKLAKVVADLNMVTTDLQVAVMKTRMQPIKKVYGRFPRVVRDLARNLDKEVALELRGEDTEVDKNLVEVLADPLVHLVRNAVDHGIEAPAVREAAGKPRTGSLLLAAEQAGDHILLTIADDGAGMNAEVLRAKAVEKGLLDAEAAARLTDSECYKLIFLPGFSTKTVVSDVSGRGVGMDVVRTKISQVNGTIEIDSQPGQGSRILIKVPLTLAIMPTMMVAVAGQAFALPLASIAEILQMELVRTNVVDGQLVVLVRDKTLPLFYLRHWVTPGGEDEPMPRAGHVVVAHVGNQRVGLVVDELIGQEEVVIKPLGARLHGTPGLAGATITGNGRIALILDMPVLVRRYARRVPDLSARQAAANARTTTPREVA